MEGSEGMDIDVDVAYPLGVDINDAAAELVLYRDKEHIKTITVRRGEQFHVGRQALTKDDKYVRLQINDPVVSKDQFRIYMVLYEDDNTTSYLFYCEDSETLNGTNVNGNSIGSRSKPGRPFLLTDGDKISMQPDWNFVFKQTIGGGRSELQNPQREDSLFFKDRYEISNRWLGSGHYSTVLLANEVSTNKQLACKVMDLNGAVSARDRERIIHEVNLLQSLDHPNIVTLQKAFQSKDSLFLFLDLAPGGDLLAFVAEQGGVLPDLYTLVIIRQVAFAVDYLHSHGIVHRDLKGENVLVMYNDIGHRVVVADFGCASVIRSSKRMDSFVGTEAYLAPEIHEGERLDNRGYTKAVDLWSLGVMTFSLFTGQEFIDYKEQRVDQRAVRDRLAQPAYDRTAIQMWSEVSSMAKDFMARLLVVDPRHRMTASQAVKHGWFTKDKRMARELEHLSERANKDWKPRGVDKGVFEIIPGGDENSAPRNKRAPHINASRYFGLEKHLHSYGPSQREEAVKAKQKIIDQLKETGEIFIGTRDMSTYTPKKTRLSKRLPLTPQNDGISPHTAAVRTRIETPRTPTKDRKRPAIRYVDARNMFAESPEEEADSPSKKPMRESQISTQGGEESQSHVSQSDSQGSMLLDLDNTGPPSLGRAGHRAVAPISSAPFSTIHSLSIRKRTPEPDSISPPEPTGFSMEIEELLQQQFSSMEPDASTSMSKEKGNTIRGEKRKLKVFEEDDDEQQTISAQPRKGPAARHVTDTQEEKDTRKDILKPLPQMTSAKKYGQRIKEKKQAVISSRR